MNLKDEEAWNSWIKYSSGAHSKPFIDVARRVMEILDEGGSIHVREIITRAVHDMGADDINKADFMVPCVTAIVCECHARGEEFHRDFDGLHSS